MNIEQMYLKRSAIDLRVPDPEPEPEIEVSGTVRPGAMEGEMRAIPQSPLERIMEVTGLGLEELGKEIESLGSISIGGFEISLRDLLPLVGYSEEKTDPMTGQTETVQRGTPQALQRAGRGEAMTRGTGTARQLRPDAKDAAMEAFGPAVAGAAKAAGVAQKAARQASRVSRRNAAKETD